MPQWRPRHTEALGFVVLVGGLAVIWWPAAIIVAGVLLIVAAYVQAGE